MSNLHKKLMFGLGLSAATTDADGAGYLDTQEAAGAQLLRNEFDAYCIGLAAEYLSSDPNPISAKNAVRGDFALLGSQTDTERLTVDETAMIDVFVSKLDESIDRLAGQSGLSRALALWGFRTPRLIKVLIALTIVFGAVVPILVWVSSK